MTASTALFSAVGCAGVVGAFCRACCHFGEFFAAFGIEPPRLQGDALLWGHCHHRATGGVEPENQRLRKLGLTVQDVQGGCCGLAGSWGFENGKYGISMDCGQQALLPAIRDADGGALIVADGFSCKTRIADAGTGRQALHITQVLKMAREHLSGSEVMTPPGTVVTRRASRAALAALPAVAALGAAAAIAACQHAWRNSPGGG